MIRDEASAVRDMFESVAPRYDLLNRLCSLGLDVGWRRALVRSLSLRRGARVLDLASGSGDVAAALAVRFPEALVVGVDCASRMLSIAREKSKEGLPFDLVQGWGEALPFAGNSFAAVTCAFGVRNFRPMEKVLAEVWRVAEPGAQLRILEFTMPAIRPWRWIYQLYLGSVVPRLGALFSSREAYNYLDSSIRMFLSPDKFRQVVAAAGFSSVRSEKLAGGAVILVKAEKRKLV